MPTIAFLFDCVGRSVDSPKPIEATLSWTNREGIAQAFDANGKLIAELHHAHVDWIDAGGVRLTGMEPIPPAGTAFHLQAWQYNP